MSDSFSHQFDECGRDARDWPFASPKPTFLMEAHDGLSALIARKAGFKGLWASGLTISTALGYRDASEVSWSSVVETVERMVVTSGLPVLVDADTGFGNFNNARILAAALKRRGAAGMCIEDKLFPKLNSFAGGRHALAGIDEVCGRLRAVKETVNDFTLIARTEALIAEAGMDEALERAHAFADAGADGILIHSRRSDADEILDFARQFGTRLPLVVVPTKYFDTPTEAFREAKIATVIWANHSLRASLLAMKATCDRIFAEETVAGVESSIASVDEIFELLDYRELATAEKLYLPGFAND